ncbi:MAG: ATP-dependent zinc metalloprotease FtsH [Dehalococcoidales bacterium]|nr:ATP-dependent zinc metalloprotease FtsH [Dehalococcoidales bacterium]
MNFGLNRNLIIFIVMLGVAIALFSFLPMADDKPEEISTEEAIAMSQNGEIEKIVVDGEALLITSTSGTELRAVIGALSLVDLRELGLNLEGVDWEVTPSGINWGSMVLNFLPLIIFGGLLFFLFRRAQGVNSQAMNFGRSRARLLATNTPTVTFDDVAGADEAKQEVREVVDFLRSREKFQKLGARIPRGLLLIGPPGTGKTLLARAIAGEARVPFYSISGSEFVEMFVGVGASRVRDLFEQAKRNTPCIIFIDEIDAVGRHRGAGLGGGHDEREQTLNQILTEMDGFDTNASVIVVAATNRPDILDPALLRPGRFDRRVVMDRPDINGRTAILKVHTNGKPLAETVSLEVLAKQTAGFSGADLANLVNESAILAARRGKDAIGMNELEESIDRVIAGPERKSRRISPKEKEITAYHEAGHAFVAKMLPNADPVHKISIVARGMSLGHTRQLPAEDRYLMTRSQFNDMLATLLAGHTAEKLIFDEMTTGAYDDIERATVIARKMVTDYGMSDKLGPRTFGHKEELIFLGREIAEQRNYSEKVAEEIDDEVHQIIEHAYQVARKILTRNKPKLIKVAEELIAKETLEGEDLEALFSKTVAKPVRKARAEAVPKQEKAVAKARPGIKKAPVIPLDILPKTAPATLD